MSTTIPKSTPDGENEDRTAHLFSYSVVPTVGGCNRNNPASFAREEAEVIGILKLRMPRILAKQIVPDRQIGGI